MGERGGGWVGRGCGGMERGLRGWEGGEGVEGLGGTGDVGGWSWGCRDGERIGEAS